MYIENKKMKIWNWVLVGLMILGFIGKSGVNPVLSRNCIRELQHCSPVTKGCWGNDLESEC